ncbi:cell envelope integrity protein CreD [Niabella ginsengisoli]|uniref:cell envelope integrity protein CreD n=1 Tax=Niabella ginsengisoli TaxID=522298 RepID=UPI0021D44BD0|nr:cell envelope integrity protein CreD [Niabella ginsengisoli]
MEHTQSNTKMPQSFFERNKTIIKGFLIGFLILLMLIPAMLLQGLVREREQRQSEVIHEISSKWASAQTIVGPVLMIPYKEFSKTKDGQRLEAVKNIFLLPGTLKVNGSLLPEVRHRSLYDVTLYRSSVKLSGEFSDKDLKLLQLVRENIMWNEAKLVLGLDDARGLEEAVTLKWNTSAISMDAGIPSNNIVNEGLGSAIAFKPESTNQFEIELKLKGSESLYFTPVGKTSFVDISSKWKHPAFDGQYLPTAHTVLDSGFSAQWKVLQVSRNYPQAWISGEYNLKNSAFGVRLVQPTDNYAKTERSVKYAILFIALTFTVFFFLEIFQKSKYIRCNICWLVFHCAFFIRCFFPFQNILASTRLTL